MKTAIYDSHFSIVLSQGLRVDFILPKLSLDEIQGLFYLAVSERCSGGQQGSNELFRIQTISLANHLSKVDFSSLTCHADSH